MIGEHELNVDAQPRLRTSWIRWVTVVVAVGLGAHRFTRREDAPPRWTRSGSATGGAALDVQHATVDLAGDAIAQPALADLVGAYQARSGTRFRYDLGLGSDGGIAALLHGATRVAVVSRSLLPSEREQGLIATAYARVPVVVVAHPAVLRTTIDAKTLQEIYEGTMSTWSDGTPIVPTSRGLDHPCDAAVADAIPGLARWLAARRPSPDARQAQAPGSIGFATASEVAALGGVVKALRFGGVAPTPDAIKGQTYPLYRDLVFVTRGQPEPDIAAFMEFVHSNDGVSRIARHEAVALSGIGGVR